MTDFRERQSFLNDTQFTVNFIHGNSDENKVVEMIEHDSRSYQCIKVLLVEDNEINIKVIKLLLGDCGIKNIEVARNGKQALQRLSATIDLVILDIGLPDISGIELCKRIRNAAAMQNTPIVAWTASGEDLRTECMKAGMDDFISKPITIKDLREVLSRNLKAKNSH